MISTEKVGWLQPPSIEVCANQCRARCCRAPGYVKLSHREANIIALRTPVPLNIRRVKGEDKLVMLFSENGGRCPMLTPGNTCRIHHTLPAACYDFPQAPMPGCLVWPERPRSAT